MGLSSFTQDSSPAVVLYVSDDTSFLNTVRTNLGHTGFSVVTTKSATEAIEMVSESQFDAILSDYNLPQMDALTLFENIKDHSDGIEPPPMLVITDHGTEPLEAKCLSAGTEGIHAKSDPVELLVERVASMLRNHLKRDHILRSTSKRRFQGSNDPVTQIANKQHFMRRMRGESTAAYRDQTHLSVLMLSIDKFDMLQDQHGQSKAEGVLAQVARLIEGDLRSRDCVARYAEQIFAVVLPGTNLQAATAVGRRLKQRLDTTEVGNLDTPMSITMSVGAANRPPGVQVSPEEIVLQALHTCNAAIKMGGNRVVTDNALTGCPLVLVLGDPSSDHGAVVHVLDDTSVEVRQAISIEEGKIVLEKIPVAMVIAGEEAQGMQLGIDFLTWMKSRYPTVKRVLMSNKVDQELMTKAVNIASIDYFLAMPWNLSKLPSIVDELLFS